MFQDFQTLVMCHGNPQKLLDVMNQVASAYCLSLLEISYSLLQKHKAESSSHLVLPLLLPTPWGDRQIPVCSVSPSSLFSLISLFLSPFSPFLHSLPNKTSCPGKKKKLQCYLPPPKHNLESHSSILYACCHLLSEFFYTFYWPVITTTFNLLPSEWTHPPHPWEAFQNPQPAKAALSPSCTHCVLELGATSYSFLNSPYLSA